MSDSSTLKDGKFKRFTKKDFPGEFIVQKVEIVAYYDNDDIEDDMIAENANPVGIEIENDEDECEPFQTKLFWSKKANSKNEPGITFDGKDVTDVVNDTPGYAGFDSKSGIYMIFDADIEDNLYGLRILCKKE